MSYIILQRSSWRSFAHTAQCPTRVSTLHFASFQAPYRLLFLAQQAELQVDVVELPDEFATGPLDDHRPPLQPHLDCPTTQRGERGEKDIKGKKPHKLKTKTLKGHHGGLQILTIVGDVDSLTAENGLHSVKRQTRCVFNAQPVCIPEVRQLPVSVL